jgi:predicted Zn-dependent protease
MTLVDNVGRCWQVLAVVDRGVVGPFGQRIWRFVVRQSLHRIEQQWAEVERLNLEQVKDRVIASIKSNPDDWRDDEAIAGEAGPPRDEADLLDELEAAVRNASSLPQIINAVYQENLTG